MLKTAGNAPMTIRRNVLQGEFEVSRDPDVVLTTVLGSCIACCLHDPVARIGGMNHFLLASPPSSRSGLGDDARRYGLYAMELLVNEMIKLGAVRATMRAHLYGGCQYAQRDARDWDREHPLCRGISAGGWHRAGALGHRRGAGSAARSAACNRPGALPVGTGRCPAGARGAGAGYHRRCRTVLMGEGVG